MSLKHNDLHAPPQFESQRPGSRFNVHSTPKAPRVATKRTLFPNSENPVLWQSVSLIAKSLDWIEFGGPGSWQQPKNGTDSSGYQDRGDDGGRRDWDRELWQ